MLKQKNTYYKLLIIDIFKPDIVNDNMMYAFGDALLVKRAERVAAQAGPHRLL